MPEPPLLFQSRVRQRMLAGLAHHGPMRVRDATNIGGGQEMKRDGMRNFERLGVTLRFGTEREQVMAFNSAFPALPELRQLVLAVEATAPPKPHLPLHQKRRAPTAKISPEGPRDLFGSWRQTAVVLALANAGGRMATTALMAAMRGIGAKPYQVQPALEALVERGIIQTTARETRFADAFPAKTELIAFVNAFTAVLPDYRIEPKPVPRLIQRRPPSNYGYYGDVHQPPPLFGRRSRYYVLATLAVHGAASATELRTASRASVKTIDAMREDGWIRTTRFVQQNHTRAALDIANVPARPELVALLRRIAERWPPQGKPLVSIPPEPGLGPAVRLPTSRYFATPARSETIMTLAAMGKADIAMIARAVDHGRHEIVRVLEMLLAFGVLRKCALDGREMGYEFDPDWYAAAELRMLLDVLLTLPGKFRARARAAETIMPPRRRKRRENATKRESRNAYRPR